MRICYKTYLDDGGGIALGCAHSDHVAISMHKHGLSLHITALHGEARGGVYNRDLL